MQSPRERAARAVCRLEDKPEDSPHRGLPRWRKHLLRVDTVLKAALVESEWLAVKLKGPFLKAHRAREDNL